MSDSFANPWTVCSLQGSSVHAIFQARTLQWVAVSYSGDLPDPEVEPGSPALQADSLLSEPPAKLYLKAANLSVLCVCQPLSRVQFFVTPWTIAHKASLSMEFSRQEYWSG